jgi:hypothetical protein
MSRSRRPLKLGHCPGCGNGYIPFVGAKRHGKQVTACPVLDYPHEWNDERAVFRARREAYLPDND